MPLVEENNHYVYALIDPINKVPFYIGKGKNKRAWDHIRGYDTRNIKKVSYIKNIRMLGFEPEIHIIKSNMTNEASRKYESICIQTGFILGLPLTNIKLNEGTHSWSKESRQKLSNTMKCIGKQGGIKKGGKWNSRKYDLVDKVEIEEMLKNGKNKKEICQTLNISYYVLQGVINNG